MGSSGCVEVNGLVIAAVSGIYKSRDYLCGRFERQPYSMSDLRSMYHTRVFDITKLGMLSSPDIFLSHDWPNGVEQYGDVQALVRQKPFFRDEISTTTLGSPPLQTLLYELRPRFWFSAHLHVRFAARVMHGQISSAPGQVHAPNPEALDLDDLDDESETEAANKIPPSTTEFLALSKCTSRGDYMHVRMMAADVVLSSRRTGSSTSQRTRTAIRGQVQIPQTMAGYNESNGLILFDATVAAAHAAAARC